VLLSAPPTKEKAMTRKEENVTRWRTQPGLDNPAGPLFVSGDHAPADIVGHDDAPTLRCGSICTGTVPFSCC
jgi:Family of unknown function (DUF6229)